MRLLGKTALITGGNSGIGLATAHRFVAEGARVLLTGRDVMSLGEAVSNLGSAASAIDLDLTEPGAFDRLRTATEQTFSSLDIIFVNAGIALPSPLGSTTAATFDAVYAINVRAAFLTVQSVVPLMMTGGSIIFNGSIVGVMGTPHFAAYAASKAAVRALSRSLAAELAPRRIRVNTIAPGPIQTPIWERSAAPPELRRAAAQRIAQAVPAERFGTADEVAAAVVFLASDDASYVYGAELVVDGGMSGLPSGAPVYLSAHS